MCDRLLNLQEIYVSGQNICIEVYGNSVGTITPISVSFLQITKGKHLQTPKAFPRVVLLSPFDSYASPK